MVTLYVQSGFSKEDMTFHFVAENNMVAFYWTGGPLGYALTGSMKRGDLLDLA
jgi:anti-sigma factor RsiW